MENEIIKKIEERRQFHKEHGLDYPKWLEVLEEYYYSGAIKITEK